MQTPLNIVGGTFHRSLMDIKCIKVLKHMDQTPLRNKLLYLNKKEVIISMTYFSLIYICTRTEFTEITWLPNSLYEAK